MVAHMAGMGAGPYWGGRGGEAHERTGGLNVGMLMSGMDGGMEGQRLFLGRETRV